MPVLLIRILLYWYRTHILFLSNGVCNLGLFNVSNGVRQGGIVSPSLDIVYNDELSNILNSAGIGCHIHNCCTKYVFYPDDLYVIAHNINKKNNHVRSSNHVAFT